MEHVATWQQLDQMTHGAGTSGGWSVVPACFNFMRSASEITILLTTARWDCVIACKSPSWFLARENKNESFQIFLKYVGYFLVKYAISLKLSNGFIVQQMWNFFVLALC